MHCDCDKSVTKIQILLIFISAGLLKLLKFLVKSGRWVGSRTPDHLIKNPLPPCNINNLAPKSMNTNAYEALECIRNAYEFNLYYSLHGNGNDSTESREWGIFTWRVSDCEKLGFSK